MRIHLLKYGCPNTALMLLLTGFRRPIVGLRMQRQRYGSSTDSMMERCCHSLWEAGYFRFMWIDRVLVHDPENKGEERSAIYYRRIAHFTTVAGVELLLHRAKRHRMVRDMLAAVMRGLPPDAIDNMRAAAMGHTMIGGYEQSQMIPEWSWREGRKRLSPPVNDEVDKDDKVPIAGMDGDEYILAPISLGRDPRVYRRMVRREAHERSE